MSDGFILTALTNKGRHGIIKCKEVHLKKEKLSDEPLTLKFYFDKRLSQHVKDDDVSFFLKHMQGILGKQDVDYKLEHF